MRKLLISLLAFSAVSLTACGESYEPTPISTPEPAETLSYVSPKPKPKPKPTYSQPKLSSDEQFLMDIADAGMSSVMKEQPALAVLNLGYTVCGAIDKGVPRPLIETVITDNNFTESDAHNVITSAVNNLC